jgi:hypothetical protein
LNGSGATVISSAAETALLPFGSRKEVESAVAALFWAAAIFGSIPAKNDKQGMTSNRLLLFISPPWLRVPQTSETRR